MYLRGEERPPYPTAYPFKKYISVMFYVYVSLKSVAKYSEMKSKCLEKLNCNLTSETAMTTENLWKRIVCIQVSNYHFVRWPTSITAKVSSQHRTIKK